MSQEIGAVAGPPAEAQRMAKRNPSYRLSPAMIDTAFVPSVACIFSRGGYWNLEAIATIGIIKNATVPA
jgi:hypothetical protein